MLLVYVWWKTRRSDYILGSAVCLNIVFVSTYFEDIYRSMALSNTARILIILLIMVVPIAAFLVFIRYKYKDSSRGALVPDFRILFHHSRSNLVFWGLIIIMNVLAILADNK